MKFVIVFAALVVVCSGASLGGDQDATVVSDHRENDGINGYKFDYEISNGIKRAESGVLKAAGEAQVVVVNGEASWIAPDGSPVSLKFTADENGYHPVV